MNRTSILIGSTCFLSLVCFIISIIIIESYERTTSVNDNTESKTKIYLKGKYEWYDRVVTEEEFDVIVQQSSDIYIKKRVEEQLEAKSKDVKDSRNWREVSYKNDVYLIYTGPGRVVDRWPLVEKEQ